MTNELGKFIKEKRMKKRLTLRALDKLTGLSQPYLSLLESGKRVNPSHETLRKIAQHIGVTHEELMRKAGYLEDEETSIVEIAKQIKDSLKENQSIDLNKLDGEVIFNGKKVNPELVQQIKEYILFVLREQS
jgi:transcriptional regulator with XRE-family HTH domain